ncbi:BEM_collapsed_G0045630.mRNA.1.CDS.1 [Saccharomyces cerevisiae]|nr:BEM_collapsed_G0045630.mRNA.1.CDS.1 [Saccharomyces cerevisiae]
MINIRTQMFPLVFPRWDIFGAMTSVFMFTYLYAEGKSNYFKGSMLILLYIIIVVGFYFQGALSGRKQLSPLFTWIPTNFSFSYIFVFLWLINYPQRSLTPLKLIYSQLGCSYT